MINIFYPPGGGGDSKYCRLSVAAANGDVDYGKSLQTLSKLSINNCIGVLKVLVFIYVDYLTTLYIKNSTEPKINMIVMMYINFLPFSFFS